LPSSPSIAAQIWSLSLKAKPTPKMAASGLRCARMSTDTWYICRAPETACDIIAVSWPSTLFG